MAWLSRLVYLIILLIKLLSSVLYKSSNLLTLIKRCCSSLSTLFYPQVARCANQAKRLKIRVLQKCKTLFYSR